MKNGFAGIQGLRALAAAAIALLHIADEAGALAGTPGRSPWPALDRVPLEAGVDLFFVISGFVMVWASWNAFGRLASVPPFVGRRLLRVVPLYWLLTAATVAVAVAAPGAVSDGLRDGWGYVAASFAFVPWQRADGFVQPVLRLGWTLEYEMLFYGLMAVVLPLRRGLALGVLLGLLVGLAVAGQSVAWAATAAAFWTDPIVLEFALGMLVAMAARRGWRAGRWGWAALVVALVLAALAPAGTGRAVVRGVPSALLVFCALGSAWMPGSVLLVGDASYALYLVHPFPMRALRVAAARVGMGAPVYGVVALGVSVALAVVLHLLIERPMMRWGRRATPPLPSGGEGL